MKNQVNMGNKIFYDIYTEEELGQKLFRYNNIIYTRQDYDILDFQGNILKLSLIEPEPENRPFEIMPCVIYLHENGNLFSQFFAELRRLFLHKSAPLFSPAKYGMIKMS